MEWNDLRFVLAVSCSGAVVSYCVWAFEAKEIAGQKTTFYILKIVDNGMKVMVAKDAAARLGLRVELRLP